MKKKVLAAGAIAIWLVVISIFMLLARSIDLEIFFVLWLIGLLVIVELVDTRFSLPPYMRYLKYVVAAGFVLFGGIVIQKVMEILST
jgi:UDP-N-acetylmuramyl pentapeptide phosphotransferase/UDP-N-acetylglucosamine-1-phosphate transferase